MLGTICQLIPVLNCGERDPMVLEFHHRTDKDMAVGYMVAAGFSVKIQEEIDKCDVLCANCHRRVTVKEKGMVQRKESDC